MSTTNPLILESVSTTIRKSIQSTKVHLLSKNVQRNWFDFCTNDRRSILRLICLIILIIFLNFFVTTFLSTLCAQITVGLGGNIMYWHHPYIEPEPDIDINNDNMKIPKIIHQTYKSLDSIPPRWQNSVDLWKLHHPDWEYKFWSDDEIDAFMNKYYSWFIPFYYSYPNHIQRVDVARYFILYHYGGVYCDLDIAPKRNIQPLLQNIDIFLVETPNLGTTNSLFGSIKHSDFLFYVMDHLSEFHNTGYYQWFLPQHVKILFSTGPTAFWALYGRFYSEQINPKQTFGILHNEYFGRLPVCSPNPGQQQSSSSSPSLLRCNMASFQKSYFQHVEGNSWHNSTSWYINYFLACQPITTLFMLCVLIWTIYYGVYINRYKYKKSLKIWCRKHLLFLSVSMVLVLAMYFWRYILFSLQKLQCY